MGDNNEFDEVCILLWLEGVGEWEVTGGWVEIVNTYPKLMVVP